MWCWVNPTTAWTWLVKAGWCGALVYSPALNCPTYAFTVWDNSKQNHARRGNCDTHYTLLLGAEQNCFMLQSTAARKFFSFEIKREKDSISG